MDAVIVGRSASRIMFPDGMMMVSVDPSPAAQSVLTAFVWVLMFSMASRRVQSASLVEATSLVETLMVAAEAELVLRIVNRATEKVANARSLGSLLVICLLSPISHGLSVLLSLA